MNILSQLMPDEIKILESVYGRQTFDNVSYNPRRLESVEDLNAQEMKFFEDQNFVSPHFFVQSLYKVRGTVSPIKFNITVNKLIAENENLRANYCDLVTRTVKVIRPAAFVKPEAIFRNLTQTNKNDLDADFMKIFEADMRRDIDIRHDPLIRFAVYRTSMEEFSVLVTVAQLVADSFNAEKFFCNLADIPFEPKPKKGTEDLPPESQEAIRDYWTKIIDKAPPVAALPYTQKGTGAYLRGVRDYWTKILDNVPPVDNRPYAPKRATTYRRGVFITLLPADIFSDLREYVQANPLMLKAILQSAWGFMLQCVNKRNDCLFCQILPPNRKAESFSLNVIPVRMTGDNNKTVEQIVRGQFRQLVISQPYGRLDWAALAEFTNHGKLFNHFLSFREFQSDAITYADVPAEPRGRLVTQSSWDAQGMSLGVYLRYWGTALSLGFLYDANRFVKGGVERLCELYELVLNQMLVDWNAKYSEFMARLIERVKRHEEQSEAAPPVDERKRLRDFISQAPILQGRYEGTIGLFEDYAELVTYYEGDRISGEMLNESFIFVAEGILSRNVDIGDGWYNTLDIIEKNAFVNPTHFLEKQHFTMSATVLTDKAELLLIPHDVFIEILRKNPEVAMSIMEYALEQMERYQLIWLQS